MAPEKACRKCGATKPASEFHKHSINPDGLRNECKACVKVWNREYSEKNKEKTRVQALSYREKNKSKIRERDLAYKAANKARRQADSVIYRALNRDRERARSAAWAAEHREIASARAKAWAIENPSLAREHSRNRRARKLAAEGTHTAEDIAALFALQKGKCACCHVSLRKKYHVDHVQPLSKGGSNDKYNLQLLCPTCNIRKHAKLPHEFMRENGYLI